MAFRAVLTNASSQGIHFEDDEVLSFGNTDASPNAQMTWETADANANLLLLSLPEGGATDVPGFVVGDASATGADLGLFNGLTDPFVSVLSDDASQGIYISHDGTNGVLETTSGGLTRLKGTKNDGLVLDALTETQTTDATVTTVYTLALLDENTYHIKTRVIGVKSDGSVRASYDLICTAYRTGAGSATIQGTITSAHTAESDADWDATFVASGNNILVRVTGKAATTVEWGGYIEYFNMSN